MNLLLVIKAAGLGTLCAAAVFITNCRDYAANIRRSTPDSLSAGARVLYFVERNPIQMAWQKRAKSADPVAVTASSTDSTKR